MTWKEAQRDHGTFCVSCHTVLPYALSRASLRGALGEQEPSVHERRLLENVTKRVRLWNEIGPFYNDAQHGVGKTIESRGTEAVLNALILVAHDHDTNGGRLGDETRMAFATMWAQQETAGDKTGAWWWLQFHLEPWEAKQSQYFGAALAAVAVGMASQDYRSTPAIRQNLALLRDYLRREYAAQSLFNRIVVLWAAANWPDLLRPEQRQAIIDDVLREQRADGGWSLAPLARTSKSGTGTAAEEISDGYATGLATFVLQLAGTPPENVAVQRGLGWLVRSQSRTEGLWAAYSLNKRRNPSSNVGRFMSDAATGFAVLALCRANRR